MRGVWLVLSCWLAAQAMAGPRVVSLAPHTTELVIAAGGADLLVGAVPADRPLPRRVAPLHSYGGIDRERLLALRPDLIVIWTSGTHPADLAWLRSLDVRLYASEPAGLDDIAGDIRALGRLLGTRETAEAAATRFLAAVNTPCATLPPRKVYIEIWPHPPLSLGGRHWLNDVLRHLGLHNTFAEVERAVFTPDPETLLLRAHLPHLVLRDIPPAPGRLGSALLARPGPRLAEALPALCRQRLNAE
ncbi:helical backbone metal receptor [endosymbiont of unidentified scaly snail isolate Monju]|uniref:helical backbone metal receptor n=1 Tax=endosymbiont of unidentified scaly snail isolate Monju TaxID=1248727 RepID=UPI0003892C44|nr:helical backbone metal receptor [endosymbiont of unidentified scaly snail isolate Monju]BAN68536.1 vitamin B12 transport system substrate-binding protein [endosymbiont of unidentified scaly snail isolate Monju]